MSRSALGADRRPSSDRGARDAGTGSGAAGSAAAKPTPRLSDLLRDSELGRRLAGGGAAGLGARLGKAALGIVAAAVLARLLSPTDFGIYFLGQTIAIFGSVVAVLGLENTLVREVAGLVARGEHEAVRLTLRRARGLVFSGAGAVGAVLVLGREPLLQNLFDEPGLAAVAGWLAIWVALEGVSRMQVSALRGEHRLAVAAALDGFVQAVVFLAGVGWMAATGTAELEGIFLAAALSSGTSAVGGWWLLARGPGASAGSETEAGGEGQRSSEGLSTATLWRRSWPLLGATALGFLSVQGDLWLVGIVATSDRAALYGSVLKLMFAVSLPLFVLNRTLSSTMAEFHARGRLRELEVLLRGTTTVVATVTGAVVLGLLLFGDRVLALLFGEFYVAATPVLVLLVLAQLVLTATGPCGTMLMMAGHERLKLAVSVGSGAYLILGSLWAGARYGMIGVAAVSASNKALDNLVTLFLVRWRVGVWSHAYLSPFRAREGLTQLLRIARGYAR